MEAQVKKAWSYSSSKYLFALLLFVTCALPMLAHAVVPPRTNFAKATVSAGYNSAALSIVLTTGQGAKFSASGTYPLVWWNCSDFALPEDDPNVEIVLVTARSTDTLTITRGADGTSAVNHNASGKTYCIARSLVKYDIDAIEAAINASGGNISDVHDAQEYASFKVGVDTLCGDSDPHVIRISRAETVAANTTVCSNVKLWRIGAGKLTVSGSVTVTMDSPSQIIMPTRAVYFDGASTQPVVFTNPGTVYPEWWNWNAATSAANGTTRFKMMIDSQPANAAKASVVEFDSLTYLYDNKIPTNSRNLWVKGQNEFTSHVLLTGTGSNMHGLYCTGTTKFLRVTNLDWSPQSSHTVDNTQSGIRCDGAGDAPSLPQGSVVEAWDLIMTGWNIAFFADGGPNNYIDRAAIYRATIVVGGSGANVVNEGVDVLRSEAVVAEDLLVDGNSKGDHCIYALSPRVVTFRRNTCKNFLNESLKIISINSPNTAPSPRAWLVDRNVSTNVGGCILLSLANTDVLHLADLSSNVCDTINGTLGSNMTAVMIEAQNTSRIKLLNINGLTCSNAVQGCLHFDAVAGSYIDHVTLLSAHFENWSTSSSGTYSAINSNGVGTKGLLEYGGFFDGNNKGRQILGPEVRTYWGTVDARAVRMLRLTNSDENMLTAQIGNGTTRGRVTTAIDRDVAAVGTDANTSEKTLGTLNIPGGTFCANGKAVRFSASGPFASNGNTKTVRLKINGTTIISNDITTAPNGGVWRVEGETYRIGVNAQRTSASLYIGSVLQTTKLIDTSCTESSNCAVIVTGQNGTSSANDIQKYMFMLNYDN